MLPARFKNLLLFLLVAVSFFDAAYAVTDNRTYQINVIIFQQNNYSQFLPEQFHLPLNLNDKGLYLDKINPSEQSVTYPLLTLQPYSQFGMKDQLLRLMRSSHYTVLLAFSWRDAFAYRESKKINLMGGAVTDDHGAPLDNEQFYWISTQPDLLNQLAWKLKGELDIKLQRYFELGLHLQFRQTLPDKITLSSQQNFVPYRLFDIEQTIRARSNKIYYFDNPAFGMIVKLTPYTEGKSHVN
jgi:hypothetical protein